MAEINYLKSYTGSTERDFAQSFEGIHSATPALIYLRGYVKAYQKEYSGIYIKQYSGDYIKHYQKEYEGTYTKLYLGDYVKTYLKQYDKQYEKNWSTNWDKAYSGQYTKTYLGEYTHQWSGNYTKEYTGNYEGPQYYGSAKTVGQFENVYEGTYIGYYARDGVGSYLKQWEGAYEHDWIGIYIKQYQKEYQGEWSRITTVNYQKEYTATWEKQYTQSFQGFVDTTRTSAVGYNVETLVNYTKTYVGNWNKNYVGEFNKQWSHQYIKQYTKEYAKEWLGLYTHQWEGTYKRVFHHNYVGYYTGFFTGNYVGDFHAYYHASYVPTSFQKILTYLGTSYERVIIPGEDGRTAGPGGFFAGEYRPPTMTPRAPTPGLSEFYTPLNQTFETTANYEGGYQNYGGGAQYGTRITSATYTRAFEGTQSGAPENFIKSFIRYFHGTYERTLNYERQFGGNYQNAGFGIASYLTGSWTKTYAKGYERTFVDFDPESGAPPRTTTFNQFFSTNYITGSGSTGSYYLGSYIGTFTRQYTQQYNATNWSGQITFNKEYVGTANYVRNTWSSAFTLHPSEPTVYVTFTGNPATYTGNKQYIKAYVQQYDKHWERNWQQTFQSFRETVFIGYTGVQYEGSFDGQFDKQYEGVFHDQYLQQYSKEYEKHYEKTYLHYSDHEWIGYYDKDYEGTVYSLRNSSETYLGGYLNQFDGPQWTKEYDGLTYNKQYAKEYEGTYEGVYNKQYSKEYEGSFQKDYLGLYEAEYTKHWEGNWTGQYTKQWEGGPYDIQYEGIYTKQYEGQFDKQYEGAYDKQYEGTYHKQYNSADFIAQYSKQYTKEYEKLYVGNYEKEYEGVFLKQYSAGYIQQYNKEYEGTYIKEYEKIYGGAWSGAGPAYEGIRYFTNTYSGTRTFHQTYLGTTSDISNRSGNLSNNVRIKEDGKWKDVSRVRIKEDGKWKIVQTAKVKEDGEWKTIAIDHDRVDINITSNTANFNIGTELNSLGFTDLYDKPKHINVILQEGVHVYSTSSTPAFDTTLLTGALGANHKIKILLQSGSKIIGAAGQPGSQDASNRTGSDGTNGGDAILLRGGVELFVESYGTIAGGGGGGGSGGYPINGSSASQVGGLGGHGAGWDPTLGYISDIDSDRNGTNSSVNYGIHGGNGGLLGQLGIGAGGFTDDNASKSQTNPGTNYSQYARSGNGGEPGSAIKGYDASRVTFINSTESSVWGDSAFKFKA